MTWRTGKEKSVFSLLERSEKRSGGTKNKDCQQTFFLVLLRRRRLKSVMQMSPHGRTLEEEKRSEMPFLSLPGLTRWRQLVSRKKGKRNVDIKKPLRHISCLLLLPSRGKETIVHHSVFQKYKCQITRRLIP